MIKFDPIAPFGLFPTYRDNLDCVSENSAAAILVSCVKCTSSSPRVGALNLVSDVDADCPPEGLNLFVFFTTFQMDLSVPL